jgi:branched-chain amino acid transport system substrate-binding protein
LLDLDPRNNLRGFFCFVERCGVKKKLAAINHFHFPSPLERGDHCAAMVGEVSSVIHEETSPTIRLRQGYGGRSPLSRGEGKVFLCAAVLALLALPAQADIVIGVAGPLSGQNAAFGQYMKNGVDAAVADINAKGGLNGEQLVVNALDDQCDVRKAEDVANQLAAADARLVVGHFCSNATVAAGKVYAERDVLMITPAATNPKVTDEGGATTFRLVMRDDMQGAAAAVRIKQDDPNAIVAVVDDGTAASKALIEKLGTPAATIVIKVGEKNLAAAAQKLVNANPTAIYFACGGIEAGGVLAAYRAAGGFAKAYGSDALLIDTFWERAGDAGEGALATFPPDPQAAPGAREVINTMNANKQPAEGAALAAYAAVETFIAAKKANDASATSKVLADWLRKGSQVKTILGTIAFDTKGDLTPQRFDWYRWGQGAYVRVN